MIKLNNKTIDEKISKNFWKEREFLEKKIVARWNSANGNRKRPFTDEERAAIAILVFDEYCNDKAAKIIGHYLLACAFIEEENLTVAKASWQIEKFSPGSS